MEKSRQTLYQQSEAYLKNLLKEKLPSGSRFFLFGSRAKGTAGEMADIDIGVIPAMDLQDELKVIQDEIEQSFVPYSVDLVDFSKISESFKQQALKKIIPWN